jgi:hypothetical protein
MSLQMRRNASLTHALIRHASYRTTYNAMNHFLTCKGVRSLPSPSQVLKGPSVRISSTVFVVVSKTSPPGLTSIDRPEFCSTKWGTAIQAMPVCTPVYRFRHFALGYKLNTHWGLQMIKVNVELHTTLFAYCVTTEKTTGVQIWSTERAGLNHGKSGEILRVTDVIWAPNRKWWPVSKAWKNKVWSI